MLQAAAMDQAGRSMAFLDVGLGARSVGLGNAYTALATDSHAVHMNPAGMVFGKPFQASSMQTKMASELDVYYIGAIFQDMPLPQKSEEPATSAWGIYWVNGTLGEIPLVTANAEGVTQNTDVKPSDYFSYQAHAIGLSYASWWMPNLAYGLTVTGVYQAFDKVGGGKGGGLSLTPGLLWMPNPGLSVGFVIRDIWSYHKWETGNVEQVLPELRLGIGSVIDTWVLGLEGRQYMDSRYSPTFHVGVEYIGLDFFRFRVGRDADRLTAGCGLYAGPIDVQYAYVGDVSEGIGDSHRIGFGVGF